MSDLYFSDGASMGAIEAVAKDIRELEREDFESIFPSVAKGIEWSAEISKTLKTAYLDGEPVAIFGLYHHTDTEGVPWLAMTNKGAEHATQFVKTAKHWASVFQSQYPYLRNYVPAADQPAIDLLEVCGFEVADEITNARGIELRMFWFGEEQ